MDHQEMKSKDWKKFPEEKPEENQTIIIRAKNRYSRIDHYAIATWAFNDFKYKDMRCPNCGGEAGFSLLEYSCLYVGLNPNPLIVHWMPLDDFLNGHDAGQQLNRKDMVTPMEIKDWQKEIHKNAVDHGWYEEERKVPELLCLVHSEVSEALEAYRNDDQNKFMEELADVAIRLMDMAEYLDVDLEAEIARKHEINKKRPYRHGGKVC